VQVKTAFFVDQPKKTTQGAGAEPPRARTARFLQFGFERIAVAGVAQRLAKPAGDGRTQGGLDGSGKAGHGSSFRKCPSKKKEFFGFGSSELSNSTLQLPESDSCSCYAMQLYFSALSLSSHMVCLDCNRPAADFSSYCAHCRSHYRQHPAGKAGFWSKFLTKSNPYTRQYNFARPSGTQCSTGWQPLKQLLTSLLALRKKMQPLP
jgi:hypothetical protein